MVEVRVYFAQDHYAATTDEMVLPSGRLNNFREYATLADVAKELVGARNNDKITIEVLTGDPWRLFLEKKGHFAQSPSARCRSLTEAEKEELEIEIRKIPNFEF